MTFKVLFLMCAFTGVSAAGLSQSRLDVDFRNEKLETVLQYLQDKSDYSFVFRKDHVEGATVGDVRLTGASMEEVLDVVLRGNGFDYDIAEGSVVIVRRAAAVGQVQAVPITVRGRVVDASGEAIAGATVVIKGTRWGGVTDQNGAFLFTAVTPPVTIAVSFVGYTTQEIEVKTSDALTVTLVEKATELEQIVVTGYQNIRKPDMVGSAAEIDPDDLFKDPTRTLEDMMQGAVAGMVVNRTDGLVGTRQKVRVRGTSTMLGSQEPVWVVDGIIQEDPLPFKAQELDSFDPDSFDMMRDFVGSAISWLNPNDIENITVLKDASATVMYGVKAANGVIVITTKKGQAGRVSVGYSGGMSVTDRLRYENMNLMNSKERIDVSREIYERRLYGTRYNESVGYEGLLKRYINKEITYAEFNEGVKYLERVNTDWLDILFRMPVSHNHSVNISGGSDMVTYYASVNARQVMGTAKGNDSESYGAMANIDVKFNDRLSVGVRLNTNMTTTNSFYRVDPYKYATTTSRAIPGYDEQGDLFFYGADSKGYLFNVMNELAHTGNMNEVRGYGLNANLRYDILDGLRYETLFGLTSSNTNGESYASEKSYYMTQDDRRGYEFGQYGPEDDEYKKSNIPHGGELNTMESRSLSWTWRNQLSFNRVFADRHRVNVMVGQEMRSSTVKGVSATTYGYFPDSGKQINMPPRTILHTSSGEMIANPLYNSIFTNITDTRSNFLSYYSSATYSYDERYVVNASIRSDASNRFGQDRRHRFLPVWSVGARWNIHNEPWMKSQNVVSELNLRATYGWQGNVADGVGPDLILYIPSDVVDPSTGERELKIRSLPYADLRWERTGTWNVGLDAGFMRNRFGMTLEFYRKRTEDVVVNTELAMSYGIPSMPVNDGSILNNGFELSLRATAVRSRDFVWTLTLNTAKNFNRVNSTINRSADWRYAATGRLNKKGYPISAFWAFPFTGVNQEWGYPEFDIPTAEENVAAVTDVTEYMRYMGKLDPDFSGGLSTVFRYKTLSLSASFNMNIGGKKFLYSVFTDSGLPSAYNNLPRELVNRWRPGDTDATLPGISGNIPSGTSSDFPHVFLPSNQREFLYTMYNSSDARVVNASYLRCNGISLSYTFPRHLIERMRMNNLSISGSVSNPFIIASKDLNGMDPEVATGRQPITQTYSLSVNISF